MKYNKKIFKAEFISRPNRFNAIVKLNEEEIKVHVPNTGRCREILVPGCEVFLREESNPTRKTKFDLISVYKEEVDEALRNKKIYGLEDYNNILREKTFGKSRFDFKLSTSEGNEYYLEVKGVTLEENKYAKFPDAKTERGTKHLLELVEAKKKGYGAGIFFLIQLEDVNKFSPNDIRDKEFGEALRFAKENGVDIFAYNCLVNEDEIKINNPVEIIL